MSIIKEKTDGARRKLRGALDRTDIGLPGIALPAVLMAAVTVLILPLLVIGDIYGSGTGLTRMVMLLSAFFFLGALVQSRKLRGGAPSAIMLAFAAWFIVSRVLLGDTTLQGSIPRFAAVTFGAIVCCALPRLLSARARGRLLRTVCAVLVSMSTIISAASLAVCVFGAKSSGAIRLNEYGRLYINDMHPNCVAALLCAGCISAIICCAAAAARKYVIPAVLSAAVIPLHLACFALTDSRTSMYMACACIAAAAGLAAWRLLRDRSISKTRSKDTLIKACAYALTGAVTLAAAAGFISLSAKTMQRVSAARLAPASLPAYAEPLGGDMQMNIAPRFAVSTAALADAAEDEDDAKDAGEIHLREWGSLKQILSFSDRDLIYKYGLERAFESPKTALLGSLYERMRVTLQDEQGVWHHYVHFHDSLLQILIETGLPGLLLTLAYIVITTVNSIRLFFGKRERFTVSERLTVLFPAALIFISLLEPILFCVHGYSSYELTTVLFILTSSFVNVIVSERRAEK